MKLYRTENLAAGSRKLKNKPHTIEIMFYRDNFYLRFFLVHHKDNKYCCETSFVFKSDEDTIIHPPLENLYGLIDILAE